MENSIIDLLNKTNHINSCNPEEKITIWTFQQKKAVEEFRSGGELRATTEYSFPPGHSVGKRRAYQWMQGQMKKRLENNNCELPLWVSLDKMQPNQGAPGDVLIKAHIPRNRLLIHFYEPWNIILSCFAMINGNDGKWPTSFIDIPYVAANDDDQNYVDSKSHCISCYTEEECRSSWEKIFDLSLVKTCGFKWRKLHATLCCITANDEFSEHADQLSE